MKKLNQKGALGPIELVLIFAIVGIIGFVGYRIYETNKDVDEPLATEETVEQQPAEEQPQEEATDEVIVVRASDGYLEIAEYGVKLKLTPLTEDAYYVVTDAGAISISTQSLTDISEGCSAQEPGSVAFLTSFTDPNAQEEVFSGASTNAETFPDATEIDGTYYAIVTNSHYPCIAEAEVSEEDTNKYSSIKTELRENVVIEKL